MLIAGLSLMTGGIALAAQTPAPAANEVGCDLVVPPSPLTATGLATPYQLVGCKQSDAANAAFVQATVIDPATGALSVYNPLVIDQGSRPAAAPVVPKLPAGAVVGIWFGFNGDALTLRDSNGSLTAGNCVNGAKGSIFGQFAYCNAPAFFTAANAAISAGKLTVPALATGRDNLPCPTTRDFGIVDMDQSDNVTTSYLQLPDGTIAQNTAVNQVQLASRGATIEVNGSDNGLVDAFIDPALGCTPFTAPDLADPGKNVPSLALNELQAATHQGQPAALVPTSDPMVLINGRPNVQKTNLYRSGVNQPAVDTATQTPTAYCQNLVSIGVTRTVQDAAFTKRTKSPSPADASNLFTFLAQRLNGSFTELDCGALLKMRNPVTVTTDNNGMAIDAQFAPVPPPPSAAPSASASASAKPSASARPTATPSATKASTTPTAAPTTAKPTTTPVKPTTPAPTTAATTAAGRATTAPTTGATTKAATGSGTTSGSSGSGTGSGNGSGSGTGTGSGSGTAAGTGTANGTGTAAGADTGTGAAGTGAAGTGAAAGTPVTAPTGAAGVTPVLPIGAMPVKAVAAARTGATSAMIDDTGMPMHQVAGTALLASGGLLVVGLVLYKVISARRRRFDFSDDYGF